MSDVDYKLQGRGGWVEVASGSTFTGRSTGFLVNVEGDFEASCVNPNGTNSPTSFAAARSLPVGFFSGGTVLTLSPSNGGAALVYPQDTNFTIV